MSDGDVLVVGSGPAGTATATTLARAGVRVTCLGSGRDGQGWAGESVAPGVEGLLSAAFPPALLAEPPHAIAYGVRSAWGSSELVDVDYLASPLGDGWHLDRAAFDSQLREIAVASGVVVVEAGPVSGVAPDATGWRVSTGETTRTARWIVDASGRAGAVVGRLGVPRQRLDRQVAEVALVDGVPAPRVTTVESVEDGWWYSTPLPQGGRVVVHLTDADLRSGSPGDLIDFARALAATRHIAALVASRPREVRVVPAGVTRLARLAGRGWAAVGDAAVSWDPMSGQGVVSAVLMGARLGQALAEELRGDGTTGIERWESDYLLLLAEHEDQRRQAAQAETRWPTSEFWLRRQ